MSAARVCACGCGGSLEGRRANAVYFDGRCRVRAHRARKAHTLPRTWGSTDVTVTEAPARLRGGRVNVADRRFAELQREIEALRNLLEVTRTELAELRESEPPSTPVGLAVAARIAGVSEDTLYRNAERYGGWKVNPELPKSQWRFDPERVRQARGAAASPSIPPLGPRRRGRAGVALLPVQDRAA
jgi:hypothetical protein